MKIKEDKILIILLNITLASLILALLVSVTGFAYSVYYQSTHTCTPIEYYSCTSLTDGHIKCNKIGNGMDCQENTH